MRRLIWVYTVCLGPPKNGTISTNGLNMYMVYTWHSCFFATGFVHLFNYIAPSDVATQNACDLVGGGLNVCCYITRGFGLVWFVLRLNVPVNNFSVISGRSHRFLGNYPVLSGSKVSCSRTQHDGGRFRTPDLSLRSPTLYH